MWIIKRVTIHGCLELAIPTYFVPVLIQELLTCLSLSPFNVLLYRWWYHSPSFPHHLTCLVLELYACFHRIRWACLWGLAYEELLIVLKITIWLKPLKVGAIAYYWFPHLTAFQDLWIWKTKHIWIFLTGTEVTVHWFNDATSCDIPFFYCLVEFFEYCCILFFHSLFILFNFHYFIIQFRFIVLKIHISGQIMLRRTWKGGLLHIKMR